MKKVMKIISLLFTIAFIVIGCARTYIPQENERVIKINDKIMNNQIYEYYLELENLNNPEDDLSDRNEAAIKNTARLLYISEMCTQTNIALNDEEIAAIDSQMNSIIGQYNSRDEFLEEISKYGLDYDTYYALVENAYMENLFKTECIKTYTYEQQLDFYNNHMVNVQHILFTMVDENQQPLDAAVIADKKVLAEEVLQELKNGADFTEMVNKYNEDPGLSADGYMMSKYSMFVKPFLEAGLNLDVEEFTNLVETSYGYHIIKRCEHRNNTQLFENTIGEINNGLFELAFDKWYMNADIVVN